MHLELSYDPLKALISARTHVSSQNWGNSHSPELSWTVSLWIWLHVIGQPVSWGHKVRGNSEPGTIFAGKVVVLFSCSVVSDSLQPHELQHARVPCPSLSSRVCSNSCPLSRWCHSTISSCRPLLLLPSIFPSIRVFSKESALHIRWSRYLLKDKGNVKTWSEFLLSCKGKG